MNILSKKRKKEKLDVSTDNFDKYFVIVAIGGDKFGVEVSKINSVYGMTEIRNVPNSKDFMKGVINIRNAIIPVLDLRVKLKVEDQCRNSSVILITIISGKYIGMIVDSVHDVVSIATNDIQEISNYSNTVNQKGINGVVILNDETIILLNVDSIFSENDLDGIVEKQIA